MHPNDTKGKRTAQWEVGSGKSHSNLHTGVDFRGNECLDKFPDFFGSSWRSLNNF